MVALPSWIFAQTLITQRLFELD